MIAFQALVHESLSQTVEKKLKPSRMKQVMLKAALQMHMEILRKCWLLK